MSLELRQTLFAEIDSWVLIDPHTHIQPLEPGSKTLADILGYHYYTELAHSAGMAKVLIEEPALDPKEKVRRIVENLGPIESTIQYSWLIEIAQRLFDFPHERLTVENWESLYDSSAKQMESPDWANHVLKKSGLEAVFLTNDFDDPLEWFDTKVYIPCLRTDDLVFHLHTPAVQERLANTTGITASTPEQMREALRKLFAHFVEHQARACAISLPPDFAPSKISDSRAATALAAAFQGKVVPGDSHHQAMSQFVFWTITEMCDQFGLPFDLMIGVNRGVYAGGVHQGRDLYDSRVSLIQYRQLFNAFPRVNFPVSVLASVTNQELVSYSWIFPNVIAHGHWWYSNTPAYIEHDLAARLEAIPQTKTIGYYSDMYKLEFGMPKFGMFKRILAKVLAERFVIDRGWTEARALALAKLVLRGNVESTFGFNEVKFA